MALLAVDARDVAAEMSEAEPWLALRTAAADDGEKPANDTGPEADGMPKSRSGYT